MKKPSKIQRLPFWIVGVLFAATLVIAPLLLAESLPKFTHKDLPAPVAGPVPEKVLVAREEATSIYQPIVTGTALTLGNPWQAQGPGFSTNGQVENMPPPTNTVDPVIGAIHAVAAHPTNPNILYIGAVNGGVWRSTNATSATADWTPLTDQFPSLSISDVEFDPTDATHQTLVAATGRFSNFARRGTTPIGILRTTDGGDHWTHLGKTIFAGVDVWAVAPRGNTILVATGQGLFRSTDQGATFQNISGTGNLDNGPVYDLGGDPGNIQRIYATVGGGTGGVFRTDDAGATWTDVTDGAIAALVGGTTRNVEIAVSADTGNPVFVGIQNSVARPWDPGGGPRLAGIFRSDDQGATWTAMDLPQTQEGPLVMGINPGGQGTTNFSIVADPTDGNIVYVGGDVQYANPGGDGAVGGGDDTWPNSVGARDYTGRLFRGDASVAPTGGVPSPQWTELTHNGTANSSAPHADSRDMDFDANGDIVQGDDGGIYRRTSPRDATGDWESVFLGGLQIGEFHDIAYDENFDVVVGGTQDTGSPYQTSPGGTTNWFDLDTADGGDVAVDATSSPGQSIIYYSRQRLGGFSRKTYTAANNPIATTSIALNLIPPSTAIGRQFVTPIALNSQDPTRLIIGGSNSVYESSDQGDNVQELNGPGANGTSRMIYGHPDNADLIIIGSGSQVFVRTAPFPAALTATAGNPATPPGGDVVVTDIAVDPGNINVMFATSYSWNTDASTVSMTRDGGTTWTDITDNLLNVGGGHFQSIIYIEGTYNDILVVGAAQGAFASVEPFGGCWFELGADLPNAIVHDLDYDKEDDRLAAAVFGRGTWTLEGVADLISPVVVTSPNGGESFLAGCQIEVTWLVGEGFENEILNILYSYDGGETWVTLLTNTPNDGNDVVTLPCKETTEGQIKIEISDKTYCDGSDDDFEVIFPSITVNADVDNEFNPPDPWAQDGIIIDSFEITSDVDLFNVQFAADPLQTTISACSGPHSKIHGDLIEFVPEVVGYLEAGETKEIEIKITVPIGQLAGTYEGEVHVVAEQECKCPSINADFGIELSIRPQGDMDIADNEGNVSDNVLHLIGAKGDVVEGTFSVINPNSTVLNVDPNDGPGNIEIDPCSIVKTHLVKVGDPAVVIPHENVTIESLEHLASGEVQVVTVEVAIPDGIPVNAVYVGTVELSYDDCVCVGISGNLEDRFTLQVEVRETQGPLVIVEDELVESFCPPDPWIEVGQVEFHFDIHAEGDHRNVRVSSGGLEHETLDEKLDNFNFFPEEIALISAGETRTERVIVKIPIGQHAGTYTGYFRVVSENGGEDSVMASIDVCSLYDLDIKDHYASLRGNVMVIEALSRSNQSGGEWVLQAFDMGLPSELVNNHDEFDGPSNAPVDEVTWEFAEWSNAWKSGNYHTNFFFTGTGTVHGDFMDWESGEFRRMFVSVFVPRMKGNDNHPGLYRGRLDCSAEVGSSTVSEDYFDIEVRLTRVVGPKDGPTIACTFGGEPTGEGALLYWGDFTPAGIAEDVNLYREDVGTGEYDLLKSDLPQSSSYVDSDIDPRSEYNYMLGVKYRGDEFLVGPVSVGGVPRFIELAQNYPNPFRDRTQIRYNLPENSHVSIKIYDVTGRLVRTLKDGNENAGFLTVEWDGMNQHGSRVASGVYYYRMVTPIFKATKKMVLIR